MSYSPDVELQEMQQFLFRLITHNGAAMHIAKFYCTFVHNYINVFFIHNCSITLPVIVGFSSCSPNKKSCWLSLNSFCIFKCNCSNKILSYIFIQ